MKKCISVLILLALVSAGAFAQFQMSAGGGLITDMSFGNGLEGTYPGYSYKFSISNITIGGYGFFDATYAEAAVYFGFGFGKTKEDPAVVIGDGLDFRAMQMGFTLLGKYPFNLGAMKVFPMAGISYNFVFNPKIDDDELKNDPDFTNIHQFGLLFGGGLDYDLTSRMYLRGTVLFHMRFKSKYMKDLADIFNIMPGVDAKAKMGFGPQIRVGVGFKF